MTSPVEFRETLSGDARAFSSSTTTRRILKLASDVLDCEGYEILKAIDAESAREIVGALAPDLILWISHCREWTA